MVYKNANADGDNIMTGWWKQYIVMPDGRVYFAKATLGIGHNLAHGDSTGHTLHS